MRKISYEEELLKLKKEAEKKLNERALYSQYRSAIRHETDFKKETINKMSEALSKEVINFLLIKGYEPFGSTEVNVCCFDFYKQTGLALTVNARKAKKNILNKRYSSFSSY